MNHLFKTVCLSLTLILLASCSIKQMTVRMSMPMIEGGITALNKETDLELAKAAFPPNIELMEGMLINDPGNSQLQAYLAQAYYGYAFGFVEDIKKQRAANFYYRGFLHARNILINQGIEHGFFYGDPNKLQTAIKQLNDDSVPALFWAASCWAKWIDLNRDKAASLAQLPMAVILMQRALELDEHFFMSGPNIFFGVYYGSRSPMLGGDFALAEKYFDKANKHNENKLLIIDLLRAQYLDRQRYDQQSFHSRLTGIINSAEDIYPEQSLINNIARQKAALLLDKESQWF
ncbi:MAG: TRAP transporter TatT component family protein [Gammaproteobacteria bacterium]|nr:TRAP transporter TatT component family protein [Gammaproteobacteria bacterium]